MSRPAISTARKALFAGLVSVGLLAGFEGISRLLWGPPPPFDMVIRISQCALAAQGEQTTLACTPPMRKTTTVATAPTRPRVVLLGGSSVRLPWNNNIGTALQRRMPDVEFVNLSAEGMAVANVARLAEQSAALSPDAVIIYAGHNEYSGTVFYGRVQGTRLWMLPVYGLLARSWIHALLTRTPRFIQRDMSQRPGALLATGDDTALRLRDQLDARLRSDLALAVSVSPAPVILSTLLRNPDSPPTGVLTAGLPDCEAQLPRLRAREGEGLRHALKTAEQSCGEGAITWWLRYRIAQEAGDVAAAQDAWRRSLALDPLPLRAPLEADDIIRTVAADTGATLLDLGADVGVFPPGEWFTDPLHLSAKGADQVAARLQPLVTAAIQ
jgi:lysophospholipase L1-like esterase